MAYIRHILGLLLWLCAVGAEAQPWFVTTGRAQGLPDNYVSTLAEDGEGFVWMGTLDGLSRFDGYRHRIYALTDQDGRSDNNVTALWTEGGTLWARSVVGNLYKYVRAKDAFVFQRPNAKQHSVTTTAKDRRGRTWTATGSRGLCVQERDGRQTWLTTVSGDAYSLPSNHLNTLLLSRGDVLWVGTSKAGVAYANLQTDGVRVIDTQATEDISFVRPWSKGLWLVGYDGKGLALVDSEGKTVREWNSQNSRLACDVVTGCFAARDGSLLISTYGGGVFRMQGGEITWRLTDGNGQSTAPKATEQATAKLNYVRKLGYDAQGRLWLGSMKDGLNQLDGDGRLTNYTYKNSALNTTCITDIVYCARSRRLYVATSTGLCFVDDKGMLLQAPDAEDDNVRLSQLHIRTLAVDAEGNIYAGTDKGIRVYDRTFKPLGAPLLLGSEILALTADKPGRVYATTARGIYRVSPTKGCEGIGREHGLGQVGLAKYALSCTPNGELLAGGLGRFVCLTQPERLFATSGKPLRFTELLLNGERVAGEDSVVTLGSHSRLLVRVSTLDYGRASTVLYAYRLDEGEWLSDGDNTIILENLSVGNHLLTVRASDGSEATLALRVPWWRSVWGVALLCILMGLGGVLLMRGWRGRRKAAQSNAEGNGLSPEKGSIGSSATEPTAQDNDLAATENFSSADNEILSPADKALLDKATAIVEAHLADNDFSVEAFGEAMCMSRSALYKKLMAATGQSPIEFMRGIRLAHGRRLLEQGHTSVSEIAARVGMSPKQFSRFFREQYGVLPSEYIQRQGGLK